MRISVDGGALCLTNNQGSGNLTFTENFLRALSLYDRKNIYEVYTFCRPKVDRLGRNIFFRELRPRLGWMRWRLGVEEIFDNKDLFLALNQGVPFFGTKRIISFCHGLSYHFYPQCYSSNDYFRLKKQLDEMIKRSDIIVVSSEKAKSEITSIYRTIGPKVKIIAFGIPFDMMEKNIKYKKTKIKNRFFLFVANNQKIKNINFALQSFNRLKQDIKYQRYRLFLVGNWKEYENKKKGIVSLGNVSRQKLKNLYQSAVALLTTSYYESFNFPVLEALSQGCPVVGLKSAIIPEIRKFVELANNQSEFVNKIRKILTNKKKIDYHSLRRSFSWKTYIDQLRQIYE